MILVENYTLAIFMFVLCMTCWGSWANTQKLLSQTWRFELFYWDLVIGIVLTALLAGLTLGTFGSTGRPFLADLSQAATASLIYAMAGGVVWNLGNLLLVASISRVGLAVAFPIGGGIAWVCGIAVNFFIERMDPERAAPSSAFILWAGVAVIVLAITLSAKAYGRVESRTEKPSYLGVFLAVAAGICIAFFYGFVVKSLDRAFVAGGTGTLTPYSGVFMFSVGVALSTVPFNLYFMKRPIDGPPLRMADYFRGSARTHLIGVLGGVIWMGGMVMSFMAVGAASPAISYALSNAAPVVAALWGVVVWKEFRGAPAGTMKLVGWMFACYLVGLALIVYSKV